MVKGCRMESKSEIVIFNGIVFRRYPNSRRREDRVYFTPNAVHRKNGIGRLHQEVWKSVYGDIPQNHEIHHKDGNPLNNAIDNLQSVSIADHIEIHQSSYPEWRRRWLRLRLPQMRERAKNWHSSDEGREWHRLHGKATWESRQPVSLICQQCGKTFETLASHGNTRFCSNSCKVRARKASGIDNISRTCRRCGISFVVDKYSKKQFCGRSCAVKSRFENP